MLDKNYNYCFIDFETTGLSHERDDIIQVGCIITDAELQIISHFSSFINPGYDIDKLKTIVSYTTGISPEQIMNGISLQEFVTTIGEVFEGSEKPLVFVGQNIQFDIKFLKKYWCLVSPDFIDTLDRAKVLIHYPASYSLDILYPIVREGLGSNYFTLLSKQVGREDIVNHDALSDCLICIGMMYFYKQKIIWICRSFPIAKSIIKKSQLWFIDANSFWDEQISAYSNKVPLLDFPEKPEKSNIYDTSFPWSDYASWTKFYYGNLPIEQFVRKATGLDKIIIATNSRSKLTMIKSKCKLMGLHDMSFVKEQQQVSREKLNAIYGKDSLSEWEWLFFLKYCSHKLQGLWLLDLNTPSDYKIYNYIRDDVVTKKSNIMLATHAALFSLIENAEYKDYHICFLDYEWRYTSFLKYRSAARDPVNFPRVLDNFIYEYDHDGRIDECKELRVLMNSLDFFVTYLFAETAAFIKWIKQQKDGRYEIWVISWNRSFPKTNGVYEDICEKIWIIYDSVWLDNEDKEIIWKQFMKLQMMIENIVFSAVSGYNSDAYLYTMGNNFVEYHEFMHLFIGSNADKASEYSVSFFSNSNETFTHLENIKDNLSDTEKKVKIDEISSVEALHDLQLQDRIFIVNNNPTKARKIFEFLQSDLLGSTYKVLVENVTWGRGKNLALSKNHDKRIIVGWYDFIMQCIAEKIMIQQVVMYEQLGLLHGQIMGDIHYRMK